MPSHPARRSTGETDHHCGTPGSKFDLADYDDAVATMGGVPLELLEGVVDRHIASMKT